MIEFYLNFVKENPLLSSAIQIGILGTIGELLAARIRMGKWYFFGPGPKTIIIKALLWAALGISFKIVFAGLFGFTQALVDHDWLLKAAETNNLVRAIFVSLFANILYGPVFTTFHRIVDNKLENKTMNWESMKRVWWSLLWFWFPALTLVFILPPHLQIGLLSLWNIVLGLMLGYFSLSDAKKSN